MVVEIPGRRGLLHGNPGSCVVEVHAMITERHNTIEISIPVENIRARVTLPHFQEGTERSFPVMNWTLGPRNGQRGE